MIQLAMQKPLVRTMPCLLEFQIITANQGFSQFVAQSILVLDAIVIINVWPKIQIRLIAWMENMVSVDKGLFN